jgi:hydroxymethylpyrimidine pyrophosphatase-like HAD family hydrolase
MIEYHRGEFMYILASDYDGTLTQHGTISDKDKAAIATWRKAGNLFGVNTGRGKARKSFDSIAKLIGEYI